MSTSNLSRIAAAETLEHKLHYAWIYCREIGVQYNPIDSISKHPAHVAEMIHAHGRYGARTEAIKKIDAMHLVCTFLAVQGGAA